MKNADMPAMPIPGGKTIQRGSLNIDIGNGLTKREMFAMHAKLEGFEFNSVDDLSKFIGRKIDESSHLDLVKASAECDAKIRLIYADALLAELEK